MRLLHSILALVCMVMFLYVHISDGELRDQVFWGVALILSEIYYIEEKISDTANRNRSDKWVNKGGISCATF